MAEVGAGCREDAYALLFPFANKLPFGPAFTPGVLTAQIIRSGGAIREAVEKDLLLRGGLDERVVREALEEGLLLRGELDYNEGHLLDASRLLVIVESITFQIIVYLIFFETIKYKE